MLQLFIASILAFIPACIAARKGRDFRLWYIYGTLLFAVAMVHCLFLEDKRSPEEKRRDMINDKRLCTCPNCGLRITERDVKCSCCGKEFNDFKDNFGRLTGL